MLKWSEVDLKRSEVTLKQSEVTLKHPGVPMKHPGVRKPGLRRLKIFDEWADKCQS